jgi:hypothetical protein
MNGQNPKAQRDLLRDDWSRWTAIVALFARRRPTRRRVDPRAYTTLHNELIAACRSLAEADAERRSYYTELEDMVRPWLNPRLFARTDCEILFTLLSRCRAVERDLTGRRKVLEWLSPSAPGPMIATGAVVLGLAWAVLTFGLPVLVIVRDAFDTAWLTIKYSSDLSKLSVVGVLIIVGAMSAIARTARS